MSPDLRPVIERIRADAATGRPWELRGEEVASLLGIDELDLLRRAYSEGLKERALVDLSVAMGTFGPENVGELVTLLELFYGGAAERQLEQAGLFFAHERRIDIVETFLSVASRRVAAHPVDERKFSAMLRAFGRYEAARDAYVTELPSGEELIREASEAYCRGRVFGFPELALGTVELTLRLFFRRKVLGMEAVLAPLVARLHAQAVREGFIKMRARPSPEAPDDGLRAARAERERAERILELRGRRLTPGLLRSQYRRLMKRYHPDVNPAGLERSKEINAAYSLLVAALSG